MKIGVLTALFSQQSLDETLKYITAAGLDAIEIGVGNYPGDAHCPIDELLKSPAKAKEWAKKMTGVGLEISALSCHGNALHPDPAFAKKSAEVHQKAVRLAETIGVKTVIDFSGCPGGSPKDTKPNWVTCPWPPDFLDVLEYQWNDVGVPYWQKASKFAKDHGVRIALEAHPGFIVYNIETLLKLRKLAGNNIGANFDPSHFFWQGMDPLVGVKEVGAAKALYHVHAKDCRLDPQNVAKNGVLDTKHYGDELSRSWIFRTVGYGHPESWWRDFVSTLRSVGYDGVLSIEHEDSLMSVNEGFTKAVAFLKGIVLKEKTGEMWWA